MIDALARIFIKDNKNYSSPQVRADYGVLCGIVGIVLNFILFAGKVTAGLLSHSIAILTDGFNNASDMASSIVTIAGFKISQKKADADHPFGHGRMEYIAALIVSFLILVFGWELLKTSIGGLKEKRPLDTSTFTIVALVAAIAVKFYMFFYNNSIGKKIKSQSLKATAQDSLNDTITTFVALLAIGLEGLTTFYAKEGALWAVKAAAFPFDSAAGVALSIFILAGGVRSLIDTVNPLLGQKTDKDFIEAVKERVLKNEHIIGVHDFIAHDYGAGRIMISLHAEVPGDEDIFVLHEAIDEAESDIASHFGCTVTIHMDPVDLKCTERVPLTKYITREAKKFDPDLSIHDLRLVPGKGHTNVVFDVVPSDKSPLAGKDLRHKIFEIVRLWPKSDIYKEEIKKKTDKKNSGAGLPPPHYCAVIHIDSPYFN